MADKYLLIFMCKSKLSCLLLGIIKGITPILMTPSIANFCSKVSTLFVSFGKKYFARECDISLLQAAQIKEN